MVIATGAPFVKYGPTGVDHGRSLTPEHQKAPHLTTNPRPPLRLPPHGTPHTLSPFLTAAHHPHPRHPFSLPNLGTFLCPSPALCPADPRHQSLPIPSTCFLPMHGTSASQHSAPATLHLLFYIQNFSRDTSSFCTHLILLGYYALIEAENMP